MIIGTRPRWGPSEIEASIALFGGLPGAIVHRYAPKSVRGRLQLRRLRNQVARAKQSRFWKERLQGLDPATLAPDDLVAHLAPLSKADLVEHFDDMVIDPRLNRRIVAEYLDRAGSGQTELLFGEYHVFETGGSTGEPAIVVWDRASWRRARIGLAGFVPAALRRAGRLPRHLPITLAAVVADRPTHMSAHLERVWVPGVVRVQPVPIVESIEEQVTQLNRLQPYGLSGFASGLHRLAAEQLAGRLAIDPGMLFTSGETLGEETRATLTKVWVAPMDAWGSSETGNIGLALPGEIDMQIANEIAIVEPVDSSGAPVGPGRTSDACLVTTLVNTALPLFRYRLEDRIRVVDTEKLNNTWCRIGGIDGRSDSVFEYDGIPVHPHVFRDVLLRSNAFAYRVTQTEAGALVTVEESSAIDEAVLIRDLENALRRAGLNDPLVKINREKGLRNPRTGKVPRTFVSPPARPRQGELS